ncbi:MAG: enoyl-CoA hydratase/isomerase family protein [Pseudomonadota bacterium]|nr:enoyl-CoA hydratase/isomerase family protein [Pseudomonadota bacterium]
MNPKNHLIIYEQLGNCGNIGVISLNKKTNLNSINLEMINTIHKKLREWEHKKNIKVVIIKSKHKEVFCAGGDLKALYKNDYEFNCNTLWHEYRLIEKINNYNKPIISFINGFTMGGGVGLSIFAKHRIAASNLELAMPETKIGFFPDVGSTFFLRRIKGKCGLYLGVTGASIQAEDAIYCKLVDHILEWDMFDDVINEICSLNLGDNPNIIIQKILNKHSKKYSKSKIEENIEHINKSFSNSCISSIKNSLIKDSSIWAKETLKRMSHNSPNSMIITTRILTCEPPKDLRTALKLEYQLACNMICKNDFQEGIRAKLIDKDQKPKWTDQLHDKEINRYFTKNKPELKFTNTKD